MYRARNFPASPRGAGISFPLLVGSIWGGVRNGRSPSAGRFLSDPANTGQGWRRKGNPRSVPEGIIQAQGRSWSQPRHLGTVQQGGLEWDWRGRHCCTRRRMNRLFKSCGWGLRRRSRLLRDFFHLISALSPGRDLAIGDHSLALFELDSVPGPVDFVADPVRNVNGLRQHQSHHASVVIVETCVVGLDDRIMICHPLQLTCVSHSAGHYGIWIDRPVFHLA